MIVSMSFFIIIVGNNKRVYITFRAMLSSTFPLKHLVLRVESRRQGLRQMVFSRSS